jgi:hypothetical protein
VAEEQERIGGRRDLLEVVGALTRRLRVGTVRPEVSLEMLGGVDCVACDQNAAGVGEGNKQGLKAERVLGRDDRADAREEFPPPSSSR